LTTTKRNAVIYCRISDDPTGQAAGVERQEQDCRKLAKAKGWTVVALETDNDLSGFKGVKRPGYERIVERLKAAEADAIVCYHPDRLTRRARELEDLISLIEATDAEVATVKAGDLDLGTVDGRMLARIVGSVSQRFSENLALDVIRANKAKADKGQPRSNAPRFGYVTTDGRCTWEIDKAQAKLIRDGAKHVLRGGSVLALERLWRRAGVVSPAGKPYQATNLRRLLMSPYLAGLVVHQGQVVGKGVWNPILDEATHEQLCLFFTAPGRRKQGPPRKYVLNGLMYCGKCGSRLHGGPKQGHGAYQCKRASSTPNACLGITVRSADIEPYVLQQLVKNLLTTDLSVTAEVTNAHEDDTKTIMTGLKAKRLLREDAQDGRYVRGDLNESAYRRIIAKLDDEISALERNLAGSTSKPDFASFIRLFESDSELVAAAFIEAYEKADLAQRRDMLGSMVEKIIIQPASRKGAKFDGKARVKIKYRF
jgi:site-specific DNA recombinase